MSSKQAYCDAFRSTIGTFFRQACRVRTERSVPFDVWCESECRSGGAPLYIVSAPPLETGLVVPNGRKIDVNVGLDVRRSFL